MLLLCSFDNLDFRQASCSQHRNAVTLRVSDVLLMDSALRRTFAGYARCVSHELLDGGDANEIRPRSVNHVTQRIEMQFRSAEAEHLQRVTKFAPRDVASALLVPLIQN